MRIISSLGIVGALLIPAGCSMGPGDGPGFKPLFNGRDLSGWVVKCKPKDAAVTYWKVDNGTILADSIGRKDHDYIWLTTAGEYGDFVLRLRFQAYRDSPGNSGVQVRSRYDDLEGWLDGPQVDINPPGPWRTGMIWDETRGNRRWLYPNIPADKWVDESMAPPGLRFRYRNELDAWNDLEIHATSTRITATLNDVPVTDYDGKGVLDDAVHAQRRVGMKGVIALQIHSGDELRIRFKDIRIKAL